MTLKVTANYVHTDLGRLPDFGVPYDNDARRSVHDVGRSPQHLLRLRQPRFPEGAAGHRTLNTSNTN